MLKQTYLFDWPLLPLKEYLINLAKVPRLAALERVNACLIPTRSPRPIRRSLSMTHLIQDMGFRAHGLFEHDPPVERVYACHI